MGSNFDDISSRPYCNSPTLNERLPIKQQGALNMTYQNRGHPYHKLCDLMRLSKVASRIADYRRRERGSVRKFLDSGCPGSHLSRFALEVPMLPMGQAFVEEPDL